MASTAQGKSDSHLRLVSDQEAIALPEGARPTDDSPTVISKTPPLVPAAQGSSQEKIVDLARKHASPESIVASLRGRRLAHFELIEPIGVGGMAAVIRARDTQLDRFVALKILPPEMAHEQENVQRFHQEAKAAAKLDHENIARVFFCGEDQGLHFIAFEFVEGITLRTMLEQRGRIPVGEAVRYILQIAAGLEHAATRGVVHRDVKPSNVIITPAGRAKLVDMGLARNLERCDADLTQSGVTLGTFDYISPEQALEPREADSRSDIYSLGCTFYHLLTGQPPVPEGTPAKKLQHHQHGQPLDPRAIDPAIPDDIVMILGKMMEKHPKDRYQRPIHLVHHLMQVAQKVGAAADVPEGLLVVDAPLPNRPRHRPLLLIGMSLVALVAVTLLLSLAPQPVKTFSKGQTGLEGKKDTGPAAKKDQTPGKANGGVTADHASPVVKDAAELLGVLRDPANEVKAFATIYKTINLGNTGLAYQGGAEQQFRLEPKEKEAGNFAIVFFEYDNVSGSDAALVLDGGKELVFKRIHFQIDSKGTPENAVAAIKIRGVQRVTFEQCIFTQKVPKFSSSGKKTRIASILIDTADSDSATPPVVNVRECYFDGGQVAIAVNGRATIHVSDCAFKPHSALFQFRKTCTLEHTALDVQHSAGFVVDGPAFRFDDKAGANLVVKNSVFSRPNFWVEPGSEPDLLFPASASLRYVGDHNVYHNLNAFAGKTITEAGFQKFLVGKGKDTNSRYLDSSAPDRSPWQQIDPLNYSGPRADLAFQLKAQYYEDRFGLKQTWLGGDMPTPPLALAKNTPPPKVMKIVDAEDDSTTPGVIKFKTLSAALDEPKDGDVIYIRHGDNSNDVVVSPIKLAPGISIKLMPDTDCHPRLVFNNKFKEKETSVFKVQDGKLEIEGMEIVLDPNKDSDASESIVQMGGAHLIFKNCIFTLRAANREQLSVISSIDANTMMKEMAVPSAGRVEFHECLVRGKGDLVALNGCRLLGVEVKNSLIALDGSLLDLAAGGKLMSKDQVVSWKMGGSSIFTRDSVFALRSGFDKVLTKTNAQIDGCLLASLAPLEQPHPVAMLEGNLEIKDYLEWTGEKNYYANFDKLVRWREDFPEMNSNYGTLTMPKLTEKNLGLLWDARPEWFKPADAEQARAIHGLGQPMDSETRMMATLGEPDER